MKISLKLLIFVISIISLSCRVETDLYIIETPTLELKASGPFFKGSNTFTANWEYSFDELFPDKDDKIIIEDARVTSIKIVPKKGVDYPNFGRVIMQMKTKNRNMSRIGLLNSNFKNDQSNSLKVWQIQDEFYKAFKNESITFMADFEMLDDKYDDDLSFDLLVTFDVRTRK